MWIQLTAPNEAPPLLNPGMNPEGSYARMDVLRNFENVTGSSRDDDITGAADTVNILKGGGGKDTLTAVGGVDMDRNADGDTEDPGETNIGDTLMGEAGDDMLIGGTGDDKLEGGDGNDEIEGGEGADTIVGGAGHDVLTGGVAGSAGTPGTLGTPDAVEDIFVFSPLDGVGDDKIVDFTINAD